MNVLWSRLEASKMVREISVEISKDVCATLKLITNYNSCRERDSDRDRSSNGQQRQDSCRTLKQSVIVSQQYI